MRMLYNGSECCKMTRWDRTKEPDDQTIEYAPMHNDEQRSSKHAYRPANSRTTQRGGGWWLYIPPFPTLFS